MTRRTRARACSLATEGTQELHELHEWLEEYGWLNEHALELCSLATEGTQELHEEHELFKERRLEDDAIFF